MLVKPGVALIAEAGRLGSVAGWELQDDGVMGAPLVIEPCWDRLPWRTAFVHRWTVDEHNNVLELRCILMALLHLARTTAGRGCRSVILTDSLVSLGAVRKGRSSSHRLRPVMRRVAGLAMGADLRVSLRFVPSERNLADGPSRGLKVPSVDPATKRKAAAKRMDDIDALDPRREEESLGGRGEGERKDPFPPPLPDLPAPARGHSLASGAVTLGIMNPYGGEGPRARRVVVVDEH